MAWRIRDKRPDDKEDLTFWLELNGHGDLVLHCTSDVEDEADDWIVVAITHEGYLKRYGCLATRLGFELDDDDAIKPIPDTSLD